MPRFLHPARLIAPASALVLGATLVALAGPLDPPAGPVAPTFKTLTEVQPRVALSLANTPGDADSVLKITQPGSYYLTGNFAGVATKHGIEIAADNVTIDLMGFTMAGVAGSINGINVEGAPRANIEVTNGSIQSWGSTGIQLSTSVSSRVAGVRVSNCGLNGIVAVGERSIITDCHASSNAFHGIAAGESAVVTNCVGNRNTHVGILVQFGSMVSHCVAGDNGDDGIGSGGGEVVNCVAHSNQLDGIRMLNSGSISDCTAKNNIGNGIEVATNCLVLNNTCRANGAGSGDAAGVHVTGSQNRIEGNNCISNTRGIDVDAAGNLIVRNSTNGNSVAFAIVTGNTLGGIIAASTNAAAINGSSAAGTIGTTDPWSNVAY